MTQDTHDEDKEPQRIALWDQPEHVFAFLEPELAEGCRCKNEKDDEIDG